MRLEVVSQMRREDLKENMFILISIVLGALSRVHQRIQFATFKRLYLMSLEMLLRERGLSGALGSASFRLSSVYKV